MNVNGLVVTLGDDEEQNRTVLSLIEESPNITLGERNANRVPIVVESEEEKSAQQLHDWIQSLSGVQQVEVVFIGCD